MTEETPQAGGETQVTSQQTEQNAGNVTNEGGKTKEQGKKEKCRPMTKVVIRRLPPSMTEEQFLEQVSPLSDYDYMYFAKADMSLGQYAFSRAYIDFINQNDIFGFREKFDNYVFVDAKGIEFPAVVEFAPFQRVPKKRVGKKKDPKCATIETDPYYISFLDSLKSQETDPANAQPKTEYSFQPSDHAPKKVTSTPLLDFLKQRKQEKQRIRDEKREEKRRRDIERKRGKEEPIISKVLKNVEEKDRDREPSRENKENKDEKEKILQKDFKNRNKKEDRYRDKMVKDRDIKPPAKNFRDREDRVRERDIKQNKKHEDKKFINKKDDRENCGKEDKTYDKDEITHFEKKIEEKRGKSYEKMRQEKKRLAETQKKSNVESAQGDSDEDHDVDDGEESIDDRTSRRNSTDRNNGGNKFKYKNKRNDDSSKFDSNTEESAETTKKFEKKEINSLNTEEAVLDSVLQEKCERLTVNSDNKDDIRKNVTEKKSPRIAKRRSSLESGKESGTGSKTSGGGGSKGGGNGDGSSNDSCLRRHKSLDGGDDSNLQKSESDEKDKDKKDPRMERRIRNKDRPAMEIYRPGMGRFSKQRMQEREKGTEEKTPSQSPTPTSGNNFKSNKQSVSEVRSMTFKRSVSRDVS